MSVNIAADKLNTTTLKATNITFKGQDLETYLSLYASSNGNNSGCGSTTSTSNTVTGTFTVKNSSNLTFFTTNNSCLVDYDRYCYTLFNSGAVINGNTVFNYEYSERNNGALVKFYGCVDFTNATVTGLNTSSTNSGCGSTTSTSNTVTGTFTVKNSSNLTFFTIGNETTIYNNKRYATEFNCGAVINGDVIIGYNNGNVNTNTTTICNPIINRTHCDSLILFNYYDKKEITLDNSGLKFYCIPLLKDSSSDTFYTLSEYIRRIMAGSSV